MELQNNDYLFLAGLTTSNKIFAFDLDETLTTYKNGLNPIKYNEGSIDNYHFLGPIKEIIIRLSSDYTIFIITNQYNLSSNKKLMIESVWNSLDRIPNILCAHKKNQYRKPNNNFLSVINRLIVNLDIQNSFYCGDAVGPLDIFPPYRWSSDDSQFAINCGFQFMRPIDLFGFSEVRPTQDIVLMMGTPGSLKTTFSKILEEQYFYVRFSQDEVGDLKKQIVNIRNVLNSGRKVVLDSTFASSKNRIPFLELSRSINKTLLICWIIRFGGPWNNLRENPVSHFAYVGKYGYTKNFTDPKLELNEFNYEIAKIY